MTPLRERMIEDMQLRRLAKTTIKSYIFNVEKFSLYYNKSPEYLTTQDIRDYILYLMNVKKSANLTINQILNSIRFLWVHTLKRDWELNGIIKRKAPNTLPIILNKEEVNLLYRSIHNSKYRIFFILGYCSGLRLLEIARLAPEDIDTERLCLHIRNSKGAKDRMVPLPKSFKFEFLEFINDPRKRHYIFTSKSDITRHLSTSSFRKYFANKIKQCNIKKHATPHTLRHTYATNLMENGVALPVIQKLLGHKNIQTTLIYTHLTSPSADFALTVIDKMNTSLHFALFNGTGVSL
jgi:integrase/recombinase XerD